MYFPNPWNCIFCQIVSVTCCTLKNSLQSFWSIDVVKHEFHPRLMTRFVPWQLRLAFTQWTPLFVEKKYLNRKPWSMLSTQPIQRRPPHLKRRVPKAREASAAHRSSSRWTAAGGVKHQAHSSSFSAPGTHPIVKLRTGVVDHFY